MKKDNGLIQNHQRGNFAQGFGFEVLQTSTGIGIGTDQPLTSM